MPPNPDTNPNLALNLILSNNEEPQSDCASTSLSKNNKVNHTTKGNSSVSSKSKENKSKSDYFYPNEVTGTNNTVHHKPTSQEHRNFETLKPTES